jgi:hypothetical protein
LKTFKFYSNVSIEIVFGANMNPKVSNEIHVIKKKKKKNR